MPRWHVVCSDYATTPAKRERIWTISRKAKTPGWETDAGFSGYGLTWKHATELADAANAAHDKRSKKTES